ncbi:DUF350 domain-containing protein [Candidatus Micrarchaeota archaeon]|nr:DUF350 domain-containing protein [Candidatus Micrarchaeota archaeon]
MFEKFLGSVAIAFFKLLVGLFLSIGSVYIGIHILNKLTDDLEEWKEIKKGNFSVGVLLAGIVLSIAVVIESGVRNALETITPAVSVSLLFASLIAALVKLTIGLLVAVFSVHLAIRVIDKMTPDINEIQELKKGNIAIAVVMASIMIAVAFVIKGSVDIVLDSLDLSFISSLI